MHPGLRENFMGKNAPQASFFMNKMRRRQEL